MKAGRSGRPKALTEDTDRDEFVLADVEPLDREHRRRTKSIAGRCSSPGTIIELQVATQLIKGK